MQKSCNVEVCTYDYPNGHVHFNDEKDDKDAADDQGKVQSMKNPWQHESVELRKRF